MNDNGKGLSRRSLLKGFIGLSTVSVGISWPLSIATADSKTIPQKAKKSWRDACHVDE